MVDNQPTEYKGVNSRCRICDNARNNSVHIVHEMLFGFRDKFEYFECGNCGCLQIKELPDDLAKYYPDNYYSLNVEVIKRKPFIFSFLKRQRLAYYLCEKNIIGLLLCCVTGIPDLPVWIKHAHLAVNYNILDVGCGTGSLLIKLKEEGFNNLVGCDPYLDHDIFYENGISIYKREVYDMEGSFDFIMLNHSFEHMNDPLLILGKLYNILKPNRFVMIRTPVVPNFAWEKYKTFWVALDAPRHLFIHSISSLSILSKQAGFKILNIVYDSTALQFIGSEQYSQGIPLKSNRSFKINPKKSIFSDEDIRSFEENANKLNKNKIGDQACFFLYKE